MTTQEAVRSFRPADLDAVVGLFHAVDDAIGADHNITPQALQTFLDATFVDLEKDTFVVERDGRIIAYSDCEFSENSGRGWVEGVVHPDCWGQGLGTSLLHATEARIFARGEALLAPEKPISIARFTDDRNQAAIRLLEHEGYVHNRSFYRMRIELDTPVDAPPLPDGLTLRPFVVERDARAVYEAHQEAFVDHWGFERDSYEDWAHFLIDSPEQDYSLWLIAYDGDAIAGICINRPYGGDDPALAWVGTLGVRRAWRKRGLGLALLQQSFALFQRRGFARAGLGVDASSLTNAVALYERAGMHVHSRTLNYRKMLRGTAED